MQFFLSYRIGQKKIVESNFYVIDYLIRVIENTKDILKGEVAPGNALFDQLFKEAYMSLPYGPDSQQYET